MFGTKKVRQYIMLDSKNRDIEEVIDRLETRVAETIENQKIFSEQENREHALEAALLVHGYLDDDANFGGGESCLEVVTSAQMFYDFLTGDAIFDYSHLLYEDEEPDPTGSVPAEEAAILPTHH